MMRRQNDMSVRLSEDKLICNEEKRNEKKINKLFLPVVVLIILLSSTGCGVVNTVDTSVSADGMYTLSLQSVGTPIFFGPAPGRLILEKNGEKVVRYRFWIGDDGAPISEDSWDVTWEEKCVEVVLSGSEQYDEQVVLQFDGSASAETLNTRYGKILNP